MFSVLTMICLGFTLSEGLSYCERGCEACRPFPCNRYCSVHLYCGDTYKYRKGIDCRGCAFDHYSNGTTTSKPTNINNLMQLKNELVKTIKDKIKSHAEANATIDGYGGIEVEDSKETKQVDEFQLRHACVNAHLDSITSIVTIIVILVVLVVLDAVVLYVLYYRKWHASTVELDGTMATFFNSRNQRVNQEDDWEQQNENCQPEAPNQNLIVLLSSFGERSKGLEQIVA